MDILKIVKQIKVGALLLGLTYGLTACEDVVTLDPISAPTGLVVDGWITNIAGEQKIKLTYSGKYFDNTVARPFTGAVVKVTDNEGNVFNFLDASNNGVYVWNPTATDSVMGVIGRTYTLRIEDGQEVYTAVSKLNRVPAIDSIAIRRETLVFEPEEGPKEGFIGEFFATDLIGEGDYYWIRPLRNGAYFKESPSAILLGYDGAYGPETKTDGLILIGPLREGINRGVLLNDGEEIGVELHGITKDAYTYLKQIRTEASNGGLLAVPPANILSNVKSESGKTVLGFFGASGVVRKTTRVDASTAGPEK